MGKNVVIIGTLDTKGPEIAYLRDRIRDLGLDTTVIDSGILGEPLDIVPDIGRAEAATYAGTTIEALQNAGSRGKAVHGMRQALMALTLELYKDTALVQVIITTASNSGSRSWAVSSSMLSGSDYQVKISSYQDPGIYDFSDEFVIEGMYVDEYSMAKILDSP